MEKFFHEGYQIKIEQDIDSESPRDCDNLGTMICFHKKYNLGDKHKYDPSNYVGWAELEEDIKQQEDAAIILPLSLYDHGGITMSVGSPSQFPDAHWDAGYVGFIVVSKEKVKEEYGNLSQKSLETAERVLRGEVETYDQYLTGDVWQYAIEDGNGEVVDSCCGFFGHDEAEKEAKRSAEYLAETVKNCEKE